MKTYTISSELWVYPTEKAAWHFVTVGKRESAHIKKDQQKNQKGVRRGFGSIPVKVTIGKTTWTTSIFPNAKDGTYLLPVKSSVRKAEGLFEGDMVQASLLI